MELTTLCTLIKGKRVLLGPFAAIILKFDNMQ
jgi:hypothetical protein